MRFFNLLLLLCLFGTAELLVAQSVYNVAGPCSNISYGEDVAVLGVNDDRVIFTNRRSGRTYLMLADGIRAGAPDTLFSTRRSISPFLNNNERFEFFDGTRVYSLKAGVNTLEVVFTAPADIYQTILFEDSYYIAHQASQTNADNLLTRFNPVTSDTAELYRVDGNIEGLGVTANGVVIVAETDRSFLVRIEGNRAIMYDNLFNQRNGSFGGVVQNNISDGDRYYFFFNNPTDGGLVTLWTTRGVDGDAVELGTYQRDRFRSAIKSIIFEGNLYFSRRRVGAPSGTTFDYFRTDGTLAGTIDLDGSETSYGSPLSATIYNGFLYYTGSRGFRRINASLDASLPGFTDMRMPGQVTGVSRIGTFRDSLLISASVPFNDFEPYISDGTFAGTRQLANLNTRDRQGSNLRDVVGGTNRAFFWANNERGRRNIYAYDPAADASFFQPVSVDTVIVSDITMSVGTITIQASGTDVTFELGGETNNSGEFTVSDPGTYVFTLNDGLGCTLVDSVTIDFQTVVIDYAEQGNYILYPNPVSANQTINMVEHGQVSSDIRAVQIRNVAGQLLASFETTGHNIKAPGTPGIYVVHIFDGDNLPLARWKLIVR